MSMISAALTDELVKHLVDGADTVEMFGSQLNYLHDLVDGDVEVANVSLLYNEGYQSQWQSDESVVEVSFDVTLADGASHSATADIYAGDFVNWVSTL